jgi:hypothetical protein
MILGFPIKVKTPPIAVVVAVDVQKKDIRSRRVAVVSIEFD